MQIVFFCFPIGKNFFSFQNISSKYYVISFGHHFIVHVSRRNNHTKYSKRVQPKQSLLPHTDVQPHRFISFMFVLWCTLCMQQQNPKEENSFNVLNSRTCAIVKTTPFSHVYCAFLSFAAVQPLCPPSLAILQPFKRYAVIVCTCSLLWLQFCPHPPTHTNTCSVVHATHLRTKLCFAPGNLFCEQKYVPYKREKREQTQF